MLNDQVRFGYYHVLVGDAIAGRIPFQAAFILVGLEILCGFFPDVLLLLSPHL